MKYKITYTRISNLFFFISNMAEWHFSCRKEYNKAWIEQTGVLTEKESGAIKEFGEIMREYGFEYKKNKFVYLGQYFFLYSEKDVWAEVSKNVTESEYKKIREIFKILDLRFKKIWNEKGIREWGKLLKKTAESENGKKLMIEVEQSVNRSKKMDDIVIHIIPSPIRNKSVSGGANLGPGHITIEASIINTSDEYIEIVLGTMAHEVAHVLLNNNIKLSSIIKSVAAKGKLELLDVVQPSMTKKNILTEIVVETVAPDGYICQTYAKHSSPLVRGLGWLDVVLYDMEELKKKKSISFDGLYHYVVWQMYPMSQYYFEKKRAIDKPFVEAIVKIIDDIKKTGAN